MKHEPFWRMEICLNNQDPFCPPPPRQHQLRLLKDLFEREVRRSFRDEANDPELAKERSVMWTPIPGICHNLELAHSHLSRMLRELTGLNAIQTYDKMKMNQFGIPLKYIALIEQFLLSLAPSPSSLAPYSGNGSKHFWKWLKAQRKNPDFDRQALAREFGFPSAARFHRALFFATGHTPREFENLVIRLAIDDPDALKALIAKFPPEEHIEQIISRDYIEPVDERSLASKSPVPSPQTCSN